MDEKKGVQRLSRITVDGISYGCNLEVVKDVGSSVVYHCLGVAMRGFDKLGLGESRDSVKDGKKSE
jgi:hypothetical protein